MDEQAAAVAGSGLRERIRMDVAQYLLVTSQKDPNSIGHLMRTTAEKEVLTERIAVQDIRTGTNRLKLEKCAWHTRYTRQDGRPTRTSERLIPHPQLAGRGGQVSVVR